MSRQNGDWDGLRKQTKQRLRKANKKEEIDGEKEEKKGGKKGE